MRRASQKLSSMISLKKSEFLSHRSHMLKSLLELFKADINPILLYESRAGKHLYAFYCHCNTMVNEFHSELIDIVTKAYHVLFKWYNHVR